MDYTVIGSAPINEPCAQLGRDDYTECAWRECRVLIGQLMRTHCDPPPGVRLAIKSFVHDFGTYYEVVCYFDPHDPDATAYAYQCEDNVPESWDQEALREFARPDTGSSAHSPQPR